MMQSSFKKFHSVDHTALIGGGQVPTENARTTTRNAPLMHSVSIVVDLATDYNSNEDHEQERINQIEPSGTLADEARKRPAPTKPTTTSDTDTSDSDLDTDIDMTEQSEEEEEEDEEENLSNSLARRVVIVDEADKILRSRAGSTEVSCIQSGAHSGTALFRGDLNRHHRHQTRPSSACQVSYGASNRPPPLPLRQVEQQSADAGLIPRQCRIERSPRIHRLSSLAADTCGRIAGSGPVKEGRSEEANRCSGVHPIIKGNVKLSSMRRYTHHNVDLVPSSPQQPPPPPPTPPSDCVLVDHPPIRSQHHEEKSSSTAQLEECDVATGSRLKALSIVSTGLANSSLIHRRHSKQNTRSTSIGSDCSNRRQSLQINLLSHHYHHHHHQPQHQLYPQQRSEDCQCYSPSRSLTEEEFRSEREFNEQVRSISKSPEILNLTKPTNDDFYSQSIKSNLTQDRCRSANDTRDTQLFMNEGGISILRQVEKSPVGSINEIKPAKQQRRVSFGSIDPIPYDTPLSTSISIEESNEKKISSSSILGDTIGVQQLPDAGLKIDHQRPLNPLAPRISSRASGSTLERNHHHHHIDSPARGDLPPLKTRSHSVVSQSELKAKTPDSGGADYVTDRTEPTSRVIKRNSISSCKIGPSGGKSNSGQADNKTMDGDRRGIETSSSRQVPCDIVHEDGRRQTITSEDDARLSANNGDNINDVNKSLNHSVLSSTMEETDEKKRQATTTSTDKDRGRVQSIMANAKLRQEEFARLLEEHEQIVNEINRVETKISFNQTNKVTSCTTKHEKTNQKEDN